VLTYAESFCNYILVVDVVVDLLLQPSKSGSSSGSGAHYRQLIASVNTVMPDIGACLERLLGYATAATSAGILSTDTY
jgi:hypothetical protein